MWVGRYCVYMGNLLIYLSIFPPICFFYLTILIYFTIPSFRNLSKQSFPSFIPSFGFQLLILVPSLSIPVFHLSLQSLIPVPRLPRLPRRFNQSITPSTNKFIHYSLTHSTAPSYQNLTQCKSHPLRTSPRETLFK